MKNKNYLVPFTDRNGVKKYIIAPSKEDWDFFLMMHDYEIRTVFQQKLFDTAQITLHQEFGFGEEREKRFKEKCEANYLDMNRTVREDSDPEAVYSLELIERCMREACGKYYVPRDERYSLY